MPHFTNKLKDLTITAASDKSRLVKADREYGDANELVFLSPASIDGKTYTFMVTTDLEPVIGSGNWATLVDSTGAAIAPAAVSKAKKINELLGYTAFYMLASGAVSADVTFGVSKQWSSH